MFHLLSQKCWYTHSFFCWNMQERWKRSGRDRYNCHRGFWLDSLPGSSHLPHPRLLQKVLFEPKDLKGVLSPDSTFVFFLQRWILSRTFKDDINNEYGIYPENGDDIVMEAVDRNTEYEQQAAGGEDQAIGRQVSETENEYDRMYSVWAREPGERLRRNLCPIASTTLIDWDTLHMMLKE